MPLNGTPRTEPGADRQSGGLAGKTLGTMGTGSIAAHVAGVAAGFGMRLLGYSFSGQARQPYEEVFSPTGLREFLAECDYVIAVLPDIESTDSLLDARAFGAMKNSAVLINVGRGNVVDTPALVQALESGQLAAAVLDVFEQEPLPRDHPFWHTRNLTITAHIAASSRPADIAELFHANYMRFVTGQPLAYLVDFDKGY